MHHQYIEFSQEILWSHHYVFCFVAYIKYDKKSIFPFLLDFVVLVARPLLWGTPMSPAPVILAPNHSLLPLLCRIALAPTGVASLHVLPYPLISSPSFHNLPLLSTCGWAQWRWLIKPRYKILSLFLSVWLTLKQVLFQSISGVQDKTRLLLRPHPWFAPSSALSCSSSENTL